MGSALWIRLPDAMTAAEVVSARTAEIVLEPGTGFFGQPTNGEFVRMGISAIPTHLIAEGVALLAEVTAG